MSSRRRFGSVVMVLVAAFVGTACVGKDPTNPGVPVGTFHVKANLTSSTCGPTPNPWEFDMRLNREGTTLYWIQGQLPVAGDIDGMARTKLDTTVTSELRRGDAAKKLAACSVTRTDSLVMALATEDAKPALDLERAHSFDGSLRYEFAPTPDSECSDQLLSTNGDFETLPCVVTYTVAGTLVKKPD